jgi:hypothetical protein
VLSFKKLVVTVLTIMAFASVGFVRASQVPALSHFTSNKVTVTASDSDEPSEPSSGDKDSDENSSESVSALSEEGDGGAIDSDDSLDANEGVAESSEIESTLDADDVKVTAQLADTLAMFKEPAGTSIVSTTLNEETGIPYFDVKLSGGNKAEVFVDAHNGMFLPVPAASTTSSEESKSESEESETKSDSK